MLTRIILLILLYSSASLAFTQEASQAEAPYFLISSETTGSLEEFPLKSANVQADIAGVVANITINQRYENTGQHPINAIYVFPASTRIAVYGMKMSIGERVQVAEVQERSEAIKTFQNAKRAGKNASLLEQQRPNVFQMSVANIMPGDVVEVELQYNELLVPSEGEYELVFPTVVGPRFSGGSPLAHPDKESWVKNPYLAQGEVSPHSFHFELSLTSAIPIQEITSPSHPLTIDYRGSSLAQVELDPKDALAGSKDLIIRYRLQNKQIQTGLMLHEGESENYFLLMLQPPEGVKLEDIPSREYIFVVDVSGSMNGFPLDVAKSLMNKLLSNLRESDKFNILLFAGASQLLADNSVSATSQNIRQAVSWLSSQRGAGGTLLLPALQQALALPKEESSSRSIVVMTDGYVDVEKAAFDLVRNQTGNANVFSFGIGSSVNRFLIEGLARVGGGEPFIVTKQSEASDVVAKFINYLRSPLLTGIIAHYRDLDVYDIEPQNIPDLFAERPILLYGKYRGEPSGKIVLSGYQGNRFIESEITVNSSVSTDNPALELLWARKRLELMQDYQKLGSSSDLKQEIINLGLKYNLLTDYTSFVAVDPQVRNIGEKPKSVKQPLSLPQGVSNQAVSNVSSVPEPEFYGLIVIMILLLGLYAPSLGKRSTNE